MAASFVEQSFIASAVMFFLAGVTRLMRPIYVPYLLKAKNPWGRKFERESALRQDRWALWWCLGFGAGFLVVGLAAWVLG